MMDAVCNLHLAPPSLYPEDDLKYRIRKDELKVVLHPPSSLPPSLLTTHHPPPSLSWCANFQRARELALVALLLLSHPFPLPPGGRINSWHTNIIIIEFLY